MYSISDIESIINNVIINYIERECKVLFEETVITGDKTYVDIKRVYGTEIEEHRVSRDIVGLVEVYKQIYKDTLNYLFHDCLEDIVPILIEKNMTGTNEVLYVWGKLEEDDINIEDLEDEEIWGTEDFLELGNE